MSIVPALSTLDPALPPWASDLFRVAGLSEDVVQRGIILSLQETIALRSRMLWFALQRHRVDLRIPGEKAGVFVPDSTLHLLSEGTDDEVLRGIAETRFGSVSREPSALAPYSVLWLHRPIPIGMTRPNDPSWIAYTWLVETFGLGPCRVLGLVRGIDISMCAAFPTRISDVWLLVRVSCHYPRVDALMFQGNPMDYLTAWVPSPQTLRHPRPTVLSFDPLLPMKGAEGDPPSPRPFFLHECVQALAALRSVHPDEVP